MHAGRQRRWDHPAIPKHVQAETRGDAPEHSAVVSGASLKEQPRPLDRARCDSPGAGERQVREAFFVKSRPLWKVVKTPRLIESHLFLVPLDLMRNHSKYYLVAYSNTLVLHILGIEETKLMITFYSHWTFVITARGRMKYDTLNPLVSLL